MRRYLKVAELARRWAISHAQAYRVLDRGDLPSLRIGGALRVPLDAVETFEKRQLGCVPAAIDEPGDAA
jgi:excisionase family DNA binding protein